jgi:RecJ-like exonuclease
MSTAPVVDLEECAHCGGSGRDYECLDVRTCPMAADGGCADCSIQCPLCKGSGKLAIDEVG